MAPPNPELLADLFRQYGAYVWRVVRRLGVSDAEVDDVTQEVFLVAHRKLAEFEGRSSLKTWLYGICLRTVSDWRRRTIRRREELVATPPDSGMAAMQADDLDRERARLQLDQALDTLDDEQRAAFVLFEIEDFPLRRIAEIANVPLQTIYSRVKAARMRIEAFFRQQYGSGGQDGPSPSARSTKEGQA